MLIIQSAATTAAKSVTWANRVLESSLIKRGLQVHAQGESLKVASIAIISVISGSASGELSLGRNKIDLGM